MEMRRFTLTLSSVEIKYNTNIGSGLLDEAGNWLKAVTPEGSRLAVVSNDKVFGLYGDRLKSALASAGYQPAIFLVPDGEEHKTLATAEEIMQFLSDERLGRSDSVVAMGGGVIGDLAGFAASVYLRGIRCFHIPTTFLAMIDASVGGKTGVNTGIGKNRIGTFHQPAGVLIDIETLTTLEPRELSAGFFEAVKQAALAGRKETAGLYSLLDAYKPESVVGSELSDDLRERLTDVVTEQVGFKAMIVGGDAKEDPESTDARSRKILNFGHTTGHALEQVTGYKYFKHGEAVGYGLLAALEISKRLELCPTDSINLLNDVVGIVGVLPDASNISVRDVLKSIEFDKKSGGGSVQWVLLEDIGKPIILSGSEIPPRVIEESIEHAISHKNAHDSVHPQE